MTAGRGDWGPVKIRRRGRHTTPSQVEKVAQQAGKAAPAVAIAGALVAAPQVSQVLTASAQPVAATALAQPAPGPATPGQAADAASDSARTATATLDAVQTHAVTVSAAKPARHAAAAAGTYYNVRGGDTLSKIANRFYGNPGDWQFLFHENAKAISNPDLIFTGERLLIPATPANVSVTDYTPRHASYAPKHARPAAPATHTVSETVTHAASHQSGGSTEVQRTSQGMYSCSGLEQIWEQAGGSASHAFMAAEIAMAESGGNPNAISPTDDFGLWQINASNGALATLNAFQNAKSAITLSGNGTNWGPWTTYHSGAYSGRC
jgi:LysM repeat protein